jgi:ABC-2 type transport system permease protein
VTGTGHGEATAAGILAPPGLRKHVRDFGWLLWSELFLLRATWFWYLVQLAFVPVSYLVFLWLLVGRQSPEAMLYATTGSWVMTLSGGAMLSLGQHVGSLKDQHAYEYYATLPVAKAVFVSAVTTRGVLLALPSLVVVMAISSLVFGFAVPPAGLLVLVLSAYAMSGFGACIGFWSPSAQVASLTTQVLQTIVTLLAPVFVPLEALPGPLRVTSQLWPTTHAALALRAAMTGAPPEVFWPPVMILAGFAAVSLGLVPRRLDWRAR